MKINHRSQEYCPIFQHVDLFTGTQN